MSVNTRLISNDKDLTSDATDIGWLTDWYRNDLLRMVGMWRLSVETPGNFTLRGGSTNGEIGPVADQIYELWNCTIFVIRVLRGKSKLFIYTKHSSLIMNLHEQQAYTFVQFSDLAKNRHYFTSIIDRAVRGPSSLYIYSHWHKN